MKRNNRQPRRAGRKNVRRAGNSQRFANRRNEIRVALKVNPTKKDLYLIPLSSLVPVSEPMPETEEQLHKVNCTVTIVTNENVTGCTFQMGISGEFAFDQSTGNSDFVPLTSPRMLSKTRPVKCTIGIPMPSRYVKGVVGNANNFLALQIYSVCPAQVASATAIVVTNSVFKLAIKEPDPIDLGSLLDLQPQSVHLDSKPGPPANSIPVPRVIVENPGSILGSIFNTADTTFPLTYNEQGGQDSFTITASGTPLFAGTFQVPQRGSDLQSDYDSAGYRGNIAT